MTLCDQIRSPSTVFTWGTRKVSSKTSGWSSGLKGGATRDGIAGQSSGHQCPGRSSRKHRAEVAINHAQHHPPHHHGRPNPNLWVPCNHLFPISRALRKAGNIIHPKTGPYHFQCGTQNLVYNAAGAVPHFPTYSGSLANSRTPCSISVTFILVWWNKVSPT